MLALPCRDRHFRVRHDSVSTQEQGKSGLGLDAQRTAVADYLNGGSWELIGEFTEVESGKRSDRPELEKAIAQCKRDKARLIIAKLDRLSRNVAFISALMERKVDFLAVDNPAASKFTIHILAAVAEYERDGKSRLGMDSLLIPLVPIILRGLSRANAMRAPPALRAEAIPLAALFGGQSRSRHGVFCQTGGRRAAPVVV
jgi:Resolvase, N terminal domain